MSLAPNILPLIIVKFVFSNIARLRSGLFLIALCLYAFCSSPTPDNPGAMEVVIGGIFVLCVGVSGIVCAMQFDLRRPLWFTAGQGVLIYGVSVSLILGVGQGHEVSLIARDIFPFLFMMMPLLLYRLSEENPNFFKSVLVGVLIIGAVFSVRALADITGSIVALFSRFQAGELAYFANAPTLLFSALLIFGLGVQYFIERFGVRSGLTFVMRTLAAGMLLLPVVMTVQRASLSYAVLYLIIALAIAFYKRPYVGFIIFGVVVAMCLPFLGLFGELGDTFAQKTSLVGFNRRFDEVVAVWEAISSSPLNLVFGLGWGGTFESPAVAEMQVGYTHSLLSSMLLKGGLVGLALTGLYLAGFVSLMRVLIRRHMFVGLALAGPILIDVFLYASFKSLDFGLVLLLVSAGVVYYSDLQSE